MKNILTVSFCLFAAVAAFAEDYEVTVPLGETNRIDAAFVSALGSKNLVKKGRGVLWGSSAMANYAGKITVEEGALMVSGSSDLGTTAGSTEIKFGATLIIYTGAGIEGSAGSNALELKEGFLIGGPGDEQWGAAVFQPSGGYAQGKLFSSSVGLSADTTFNLQTGAGFTGGQLNMNGHSLTSYGHLTIARSRVPHTADKPAGDILVKKGGYISFNSYVSGNFGDPSATITVEDGAMVRMYNALQIPLWTLVLQEGSTLQATGSDGEAGGSGDKPASDYNVWGGDVVWNTTTNASAIGIAGGCLTFKGKVTGAGTIRSDRGTIVFEKPCAETLAVVTTNTRVVLPSVDNYWGHGGMIIGYRADGWIAGYDDPSRVSGTASSHCPEGPGPHLSKDYWTGRTGSGPNHAWQSLGYIWNREGTNVTWTFTVSCNYNNWIYLDGTQIGNNTRWQRPSYSLTLTPGAHKFDIRTQASSGSGGPEADADKATLNGKYMTDDGTGYLLTTDTVSRAEVILENTTKRANFTFGNNSILDANGMPIELTDISGFATITNAMTCKIKGTWSVKAADINAGKTLKVTDGTLSFDNVTVAVDDVDALAHVGAANKYHELCSAKEPITGWPVGTVLKGAKREWKLVLSADGKTAGLDYVPKGIILVVR